MPKTGPRPAGYRCRLVLVLTLAAMASLMGHGCMCTELARNGSASQVSPLQQRALHAHATLAAACDALAREGQGTSDERIWQRVCGRDATKGFSEVGDNLLATPLFVARDHVSACTHATSVDTLPLQSLAIIVCARSETGPGVRRCHALRHFPRTTSRSTTSCDVNLLHLLARTWRPTTPSCWLNRSGKQTAPTCHVAR